MHHARHHASTNDPTTTTDPDNVQSGDQTGPDTPGTTSSETTSSESESSVDSEQGQPGEPANGHQDTGANAVNECTGNCVQ
jgi:hypothetical protein